MSAFDEAVAELGRAVVRGTTGGTVLLSPLRPAEDSAALLRSFKAAGGTGRAQAIGDPDTGRLYKLINVSSIGSTDAILGG